MKLETFGLWFLAIKVTASPEEYNKLCPDLHGTKHEVNPGEWALVKCGWVGSHDGRQTQNHGIASPAACAKLCSDVAACTHSSWGVGKKCLLSGTRFAEREVKNSVLLVKTLADEEDECPEDDPYCGDEESCEEKLEESESQVKECKNDKSDCAEQLDQCLTDKEELLQQSVGIDLDSSSGVFLECDDGHGTTFTTPNNKNFKIDCNQGGNFTPIKKYKSKTFARCVDECAYYSDCKAVDFIKSGSRQGFCQLYQLSEGDMGKWALKEDHASAILLEE